MTVKSIYCTVYVELEAIKNMPESEFDEFLDMRLSDAKKDLYTHMKKIKNYQKMVRGRESKNRKQN